MNEAFVNYESVISFIQLSLETENSLQSGDNER